MKKGLILTLIMLLGFCAKAQADSFHDFSEAVKQGLGNSNFSDKKLSTIDSTEGTVIVVFLADDSFTINSVKAGIRSDVAKIMRALKASGHSYEILMISVSFPMLDDYGNATPQRVVMASYAKETIDRINFQNFLSKDVYAAADASWIDPDF